MNKLLRFSLLSLLAILTSSTYALKTVTIDFDNDYQTIFPTLTGVSSSDSNAGDIPADGIRSAEIDGIYVLVAPAEDAKTPSRIWGTSPRLRMYSGAFVVMSVGGYAIKKIEFTGHNTNFNITPDSGTLTDKVWEGNALGVVFEVAKNTQISSMVITLGDVDEEVITWTVAGTAPLVEKSWDPADASADMTSTDGENFVYTKEGITLEKGTDYKFKVAKNHAWDEAYPSSDYVVTVDETATYKIEITFNSKTKEVGFKSEKTGAPAEVTHNYSVIGTLVGNWDVDTDMTKGEDGIFKAVFTNVATGNYEFKVRADKDWSISYPGSNYKLTVEKDNSIVTVTFNEETKTVEATVKAIEILTIAKALEIINALEDGKTTADEYIVKGFVTSITEISTKYGNATFIIADEKGGSNGLTVFRTKGLNGESITDENLLKVNDEVVVQGKLQKYVKNGEMTPELAQGGKIISITSSGDTPETQGVVWDFTVLPTQKIDNTGNIETNVEGGVLPNDDGASWSAFYNKEAIDGAEFMATASEVLELTKGLKWYINGAKKVYYRNYPVESGGKPYGGKYIFINDGDNATEVCVPAKKGEVIELIASTAKNNKKVTSEDVAETFETSDGETLHGVVIDGTTNYDWKSYMLTVTRDNPFLKFEKNMCIQKITVKDATGIDTVKSNAKVNNGAIYNLAGQKVGKDYKGIVIMNGKKFMQK